MNLGQGVGVAVIDSGITVNRDLTGDASGVPNWSDLVSRVRYEESFVAGEGPEDNYGHGTHLAGTIAGDGSNSAGPLYTHNIFGVAPGVQLINLKVLDRNGASTDSQVIQAIERAIELKDTYNIKVINLSLGRPVFESYKTDPLCQEVEKTWQAGITVVVAAGNAGRDNAANTLGYATIASPANDPRNYGGCQNTAATSPGATTS